jgi:GTP-binding protein Era
MVTPDVLFKSGFIALLGRPNSGKSTLMNTILGEELSVVTPLPQTTRKNIRGIYTDKNMQLVFVDTPGIHKGKYAFNDAMVREARGAFEEGSVDCVVYLVDLSRDFGDEEDFVASIANASKIPLLIVFNKLDQCSNPDEKKSEFLKRYPQFEHSSNITISAIQRSVKQKILEKLDSFIKAGPRFYDEESLTDENMRFFAAELIRKHIILNTREEVPHAVFVEIEDYRETEQIHRVSAVIHVETIGQKGIIIGKGGSLITKIRKAAEADLAKLAGCPVSISCHLKVSPDWRDNAGFLSAAGLHTK